MYMYNILMRNTTVHCILLSFMHNVYLAAQFQIKITDVAINLYHLTYCSYCVGSIMYDFFIKKNKLGIHIICETIYNVILGALMQV